MPANCEPVWIGQCLGICLTRSGYPADDWDTQRLRRIHVALAATLPHPLFEYGHDRLDRVTERAIQEQLVPMLHRDERPALNNLKEQVWLVLKPLIYTYANQEAKFQKNNDDF